VKEHTDKQFENDLHKLRQDLLLMGGKVEQMIAGALRAFETRDPALAQRTILSDNEVNRMEVETDELCLKMLALRQPAASDLRFITIALKIVTDLERIGDLAVNVSERAQELAAGPPAQPVVDFRALGTLAQGLLRDALDAFVAGDVAKAEEVLVRDQILDARYADALAKLLAMMRDQADSLHYATRAFAVAKYLERIGDHAKNLAEMVIFMVKGKDIRHMTSRSAEGAGGAG
jgi:phosphate transport system protein